MRTIPADYNAATTSGALRLGFQDSRQAIQDLGIGPGDWAWLSDGEVLVGARLEQNSDAGLVGVPRWETLVHLDEPQSKDSKQVWNELQRVWQQFGSSRANIEQAFQLLTVFEAVAPPETLAVIPPGSLAMKRAGALYFLGQMELALIEIEDARRASPGSSYASYLYFEILRHLDLDRATREAEALARNSDAKAATLAACMNVWAAVSDPMSDDEFVPVGRKILGWVDRFERAPGRDQVQAWLLARVQFTRGLVLLRLGHFADAKVALNLALAAAPDESSIREALLLDGFDHRARALGARYREKPPNLAA